MEINQRNILILIGLLTVSASQIISHYTKLPGFILGGLTGIGIAFMVWPFKKKKAVRE